MLETVHNSKLKFNPKGQIEVRSPYTYKCSGAVYTGEWLGNLRHGYGTMQWQDGSSYYGQWSLGKAHGYGKFVYANGDMYTGRWRNDKTNGWGQWQRTDLSASQ